MAINLSDSEFMLLKKFILHESGNEINEDKRYLFTTRLSVLLEQERCSTFSQFYKLLISGKKKNLIHEVIAQMTTHESGFFRDRRLFDVFSVRILPRISRHIISGKVFLPPRLRILSAGCSIGQEPYTIAICVHEYLSKQPDLTTRNVTILGIDVSSLTLDRARTGLYSSHELGRDITQEEKNNYFIKSGNNWQLCPDIVNMVDFRQANLLRPDVSFGKFDVIFCRNVIIYFTPEGRDKMLKFIKSILKPEGVLLIGAAENLYSNTSGFITRSIDKTTYYTIR